MDRLDLPDDPERELECQVAIRALSKRAPRTWKLVALSEMVGDSDGIDWLAEEVIRRSHDAHGQSPEASANHREPRRREPRKNTGGIDDTLNRAVAEYGVTVDDKRAAGGALWILGEPEDFEVLIKGPLAEFGPWQFSRTKKKVGYWTKWHADQAALEL